MLRPFWGQDSLTKHHFSPPFGGIPNRRELVVINCPDGVPPPKKSMKFHMLFSPWFRFIFFWWIAMEHIYPFSSSLDSFFSNWIFKKKQFWIILETPLLGWHFQNQTQEKHVFLATLFHRRLRFWNRACCANAAVWHCQFLRGEEENASSFLVEIGTGKQ